MANAVMPHLIPAKDGIFDRHPLFCWIPACAGMTNLGYLSGNVIKKNYLCLGAWQFLAVYPDQ